MEQINFLVVKLMLVVLRKFYRMLKSFQITAYLSQTGNPKHYGDSLATQRLARYESPFPAPSKNKN